VVVGTGVIGTKRHLGPRKASLPLTQSKIFLVLCFLFD
jgi:hypothetical protein